MFLKILFQKRFGFLLGGALSLAGLALAGHSADLNGDGPVDQADLAQLISEWRATGLADLNHDGIVSAADAGILFSSWGVVSPPPGGATITDNWTGSDGSSWSGQWQVTASPNSSADIVGNQGRLITSTSGSYTGPFVRARIPGTNFSGADISLTAQPAPGGSPLEIRLFPDSPAVITFELHTTGWYRLRRGATVAVDGTAVGNRPPDAVAAPWRIRLRLERNYNGTDIYMKRWADGSPEPQRWYHAVWQDEDPTLFAARGPIELAVINRGSGWLVDNFYATQIPDNAPLVKTTPIRPIDATTDLRIPYDGRDISLILPQALARVPPGSTVYFEPNGRYGIESELSLRGLVNITLIGQGARFVRTTAGVESGIHWRIANSSNVVARNFEIAGKETTWTYSPIVEFDAGVRIESSQNITLEDFYIHHVGGDAVQGHSGAQNVVVRRLRADNIRRQGVSFNNGDGFTLEDSDFKWIGRSVIDIEPYAPDWVANNVILRRNTATHFVNYFIAGGGAGQHNGMTIEDNTATGGLGFGLVGGSYTDPNTGAMVWVPATRVAIRGNTYTWNDPEVVQSRDLTSFSLRASDSILIENNNWTFRDGYDIEFRAPSGIIRNNIFAGVNGGMLVDTGGSPQNMTVQNNTVTRQNGAAAPIIIR